MLKILVNNKQLDTSQESIKYTKVGNDIGDLESRETDYTESFSAPKTANNVQILDGLGLNNDISTIPYTKVTAQILDNGNALVKDGWLNIKETTNEYKLHIYEGIIDLFKAIENKTFGDDVDLSEINHNKNLTTIINSFTNPNYRYIINDYGGKTHLVSGLTASVINIDYLIPSVRIKYLWDKIFSTFGFNYIGNVFNTWDFDTLWITFPKGLNLDNNLLYADLSRNTQINNLITPLSWENINLINGTLINNWQYVVPETAYYKLEFQFEFVNLFNQTVEYRIYINNNLHALHNDTIAHTTQSISLNLGDVITVFPVFSNNYNNPFLNGVFGSQAIIFKSGSLKVYKYQDVTISFTDELKDLKITDFFKEILWLFGLTIFKDIDGNYIFKTFDQRLQSGVIDWTDKYVERTSETYTLKDYAQINTFKHEYNDDNADFSDGKLYVNNENLSDEKTIINSKIFSHDKQLEFFKINTTSSETIFPTPLWEAQSTENNGVQETKYKELSKRFYFIREETINKHATLKSGIIGNSQSVTSLPIARFLKTTYKDFVSTYYANNELLFNDFRLHKIRLALNTPDFINLDFDKIYYFKQEQNYYFLNKASFEKGKISNAEFYRIKYKSELSQHSYVTITEAFINGTTTTINYFSNAPSVTLQISTDGLLFTNYQVYTTNPIIDDLPAGTTHVRLMIIVSGVTTFSNIIQL